MNNRARVIGAHSDDDLRMRCYELATAFMADYPEIPAAWYEAIADDLAKAIQRTIEQELGDTLRRMWIPL